MKLERRILYTAVGYFRQVTNSNGETYPVVLVNQQEYRMDIQEMTVWTLLNWRLLDMQGVEKHYEPMCRDLRLTEYRTLEHCLGRLVTRGLVAAGYGETDQEALYDLLSSLYVVPISESLPLRAVTFLKMILLDGVSLRKAWELFRRVQLEDGEVRVMELAKQTLLSTAELIKCVDMGVTDISTDEKLMNALYCDTETTSDNIGEMMRISSSRKSVTMAVASLCLHKQIIFDRA